jgi:hypothetical protein
MELKDSPPTLKEDQNSTPSTPDAPSSPFYEQPKSCSPSVPCACTPFVRLSEEGLDSDSDSTAQPDWTCNYPEPCTPYISALAKTATPHVPITGDGPGHCCPFETAFASISLHKSNKIRFLQFENDDIVGVREVINHFWPQKLHSEREYAASYEFKLHGNPWGGQGNEAVPARIVMREIFAYLYSVGWILHVTTDVSKKPFEKDTLIFRNQGKPPPPADWLAISFNQRDRLRLIGADENLIAAFKLLMKNMRLWDSDGWKDECLNAFEIRLHDHPWVATGEDTVTARALLLKMLETLEHHGWSVYCSLDQSNGHGTGSPEADSWYCLRRQSWQKGNAVHHR